MGSPSRDDDIILQKAQAAIRKIDEILNELNEDTTRESKLARDRTR